MNFTFWDGSIVAVLFFILVWIVYWTQKRSNSVVDFLAANRCAGRYLLTVASGATGLGVISIVASWELYYKLGFSAIWWQAMLIPAVGMILSVSGFVTYRFRETRAMTMAEFFELRYSRKFRIFAGMVACGSGVLNYAIFPSVAARALIYIMGLPIYTVQLFGLEIDLTLAVVMACLLTAAVLIAIVGGQVTIMVTDFVQAQVVNIVIFIVIFILMFKVDWSHIISILSVAPAGQSKLNPFDIKDFHGFNIWYFIFQVSLIIYGFRAWQGSQGYSCSAKSPHEARMAGVLVGWREYIVQIFVVFIPVCIFVVLNGKGQNSGIIGENLSNIVNLQIREQMTVPLGLVQLLPVGVVGLLCAAFIGGTIATDNTYLHSWGSILIQDILMPLRGKPFQPKAHLKLLRFSIAGVAIFAFLFSLFFTLKDYIFMYFAITGAIYLGGAGAVILGGLYWKRGTVAGAWTAMVSGSILSLIGVLLQNIFWPHILPSLKEKYYEIFGRLPNEFPISGMTMAFAFALLAFLTYIVVSLFSKPDKNLDFDKLFHRGKYAVAEERPEIISSIKLKIFDKFGISKEFTLTDKIICFASIFLTFFWVIMFIIGCVINSRYKIPIEIWGKWWAIYFIVNFIIAAFVAVWFFWGGLRDFKELIHSLTHKRKDNLDDGYVIGHKRLSDIEDKEEKKLIASEELSHDR
ncbi:MAG: hypothetical protein A2Y10_01190 [Planctomycetes bacterium GWF2_41_51]|nr:MAG: hypothetical protein A2Y10_01190 [Planctomycetes bacterium GWF2_41_51]HBG25617.1 sodium:solute symporter [Phycisphaerales bacterium]